MNKKFGLLSFIILILISFSNTSFAARIKAINELNLDNSIIKTDENYNLPKKIIITPITINASDSNLRDDDWFKGIFYYTIDILGFNDIPFHYVVSKTGSIYSGNSGGYERKISVKDIGDDVILIGYMTDKFASQIDNRAKDDLTELLTLVASANNINPDNIEIRGTKFVRNEVTKTVTIEETDLFGLWNIGLIDIISSVKEKYNPVKKIYSVSNDSISIPNNNIEPGNTIEIPITLTNTSEFGMYSGTESAILLSRVNGENSNFFINKEWISQSEVGLMKEDDVLQPFQSNEFIFKVKIPLVVGTYSETFEIKNVNGDLISPTPITISFNITATTREIVEILPTETGTLNVRSIPSSVGDEITVVSEGERFFKTADAGNGWIEIELTDGTKGWIAGWYTKGI